MQVTILLSACCVVCGFQSRGMLFGTGRPGMRSLRTTGTLIGIWEPVCVECGHPTGQPTHSRPDQETTARLRAWQQRQRAKRKERAA